MNRQTLRIVSFLAVRDLVKDKRIVMLVVFLLAFSYVNLTFFPAFLNGLSNTFQSEIIDTYTSHILIQPDTDNGKNIINFAQSLRKKIELVPGVTGAAVHLSASGTVSFKDKSMGVSITSLRPSEDASVTLIDKRIIKGTFLSDTDRDEIILGRNIAGEKIEDQITREGGFGVAQTGLGGADVGDRVRIKFENGVEKEYRVKGIADAVGFSFVSMSIFMSREELEEVLDQKDQATAILVRLRNKDEADQVKSLILEGGIKNAKILTWQEASSFTEGINQTFGIVTVISSFVGVVIVVATIGIVLFINITRKRRVIGVLKAVGMDDSLIMYVFLFESVIFGIMGTILGFGIISAVVFFMTISPLILPLGALTPILTQDIAIVAAEILIISSVGAGYFPARIAEKQKVLDNIKVVE